MQKSEDTIEGPRNNRIRRVLTKESRTDLSTRMVETNAQRSLWALLLGVAAFVAGVLSYGYLPEVVSSDVGDVSYSTFGAVTCLSFVLGGCACLVAGGLALTAYRAIPRRSVLGSEQLH